MGFTASLREICLDFLSEAQEVLFLKFSDEVAKLKINFDYDHCNLGYYVHGEASTM